MGCLQVTTFFRFLYDPRNSNLAINMYNSPYKDWNDKALDSIVAYTQVNKQTLNISKLNLFRLIKSLS